MSDINIKLQGCCKSYLVHFPAGNGIYSYPAWPKCDSSVQGQLGWTRLFNGFYILRILHIAMNE